MVDKEKRPSLEDLEIDHDRPPWESRVEDGVEKFDCVECGEHVFEVSEDEIAPPPCPNCGFCPVNCGMIESYPQAYSHLREVLEGRDDISPQQVEEILDEWGLTAQRYVAEHNVLGGRRAHKYNIRSKRMRMDTSPGYLDAKYTQRERAKMYYQSKGYYCNDGRIC